MTDITSIEQPTRAQLAAAEATWLATHTPVSGGGFRGLENRRRLERLRVRAGDAEASVGALAASIAGDARVSTVTVSLREDDEDGHDTVAWTFLDAAGALLWDDHARTVDVAGDWYGVTDASYRVGDDDWLENGSDSDVAPSSFLASIGDSIALFRARR